MSDRKLGVHSFNFNERDNGGESLILDTTAFANGDPGGVYLNQRLTLHSYCNAASFEFIGTNLTPEVLRRLADGLEQFIEQCKLST